MNTQKNEVLESQKVNNDDLPKNGFKSNFKGVIRGYMLDFDDSIEPSYLELDLRYFADPPEDSVYP